MEGIDWTAVAAIAAVASLAGHLVMGGLLWRMRGEFATRRDAGETTARLNRHNERIVALESRIAALPTEKSLHELAIMMERLSGELKVAIERISGVQGDLDRIEQTLERHEDILSQAARQA